MVVMSEGRVAAIGPTAEIMGRIDLFPLTGRAEAGAILNTRIAEHDVRFGLTTLRTAAGDLRVPYIDMRLAAQLRVRIRARDVMIALEPPRGLSALNILPGTVAEIGEAESASVETRLQCGGGALIARLTQRPVQTLGPAPGPAGFSGINSNALDPQAFPGAAP